MSNQLIVLNKQAGWSCFPHRNDPSKPSMLEHLLNEYPEQGRIDWPQGFDGGIAHRLDVSTSGQLLVATNLDALRQLRSDFADKQLLKRYLFLTRKEVPWNTHAISMAIAHHPKNKRKMVVQRGRNTPHRGRWYPAETAFRFVERVNELNLWEATMKTGVMHQIRLHAAMLGLALVGDQLYGGGDAPVHFPATFALHHVGIQSGRWLCADVEPPEFWFTS